jgi:hypothetical protein
LRGLPVEAYLWCAVLRRRALVSALLVAPVALAAGARVASAAPPAQGAATAAPIGQQPTSADLDRPHELRSGIVIGFDAGIGIAEASGYPNDINHIGDSSYYSATSAMLGGGGGMFVMGALADWVNFGFWFGIVRGGNGDFKTTGRGIGFRVETFPLYKLFPALSGLGVMGRFGIGSATIDTKLPGNYPQADGSQSYVGVGVFHEWKVLRMLGGHLSLGPTVDFDAIFSTSIEWHGTTVGGRIAFYGGP